MTPMIRATNTNDVDDGDLPQEGRLLAASGSTVKTSTVECLVIDNLFFSILTPEVHTLNLHTLASHRTFWTSLMYASSAAHLMFRHLPSFPLNHLFHTRRLRSLATVACRL